MISFVNIFHYIKNNQMEQKLQIFPQDKDNRIQKLYYDINIHTFSIERNCKILKKNFVNT